MKSVLLSTFLLALREIRRNLMRSFLTVLGIVIGVAAVVTMVTLGNGATRAVSDQISSLGSNLLMIRPGQRLGPGRESAGAPAFKKADVDVLRSQVTGLDEVVPVAGSSVTVVAGNNNWSTTVSGTTNGYLKAGNWKIASGRAFLDDEERAGKAVCIIGASVRRELFGTRNPLGDEIRVKSFACQVVGLLAAKGQGAMGMDQDDTVLMPLATVQRRLIGNQDVSSLMVSLRDGTDAKPVMEQIRSLLRERRKLAANEADNFNVMDTKQIAETLSGTISTMTGLLGAVAAVSLLVGGIGIMNIMLVSVIERTREIGLRKAIGATPRAILTQFLAEAVVISVLGGLMGTALGVLGALGLAAFAPFPPLIQPAAILLATGFSAAVGLFFGIYPARRAAHLNPIDALRFE